MANISHLPEFIQAAQSEFWSIHPELYEKWLGFLGRKIQMVQRDELNEAEYIETMYKIEIARLAELSN